MNATALIVDDEHYAIMGIRDGIDWEALRIADVYDACNVRQAMRVFEERSIDILICDIEMPRGTGIELLEWVNEHSPRTETIFLTAHAEFGFVQRAVQLDSFDYMLKPVDFAALQATIARALASVEKERELASMREQYAAYRELIERQKSRHADRFWHDVLEGRVRAGDEEAERLMREYAIPLSEDRRMRPIALSVESWPQELESGDEDVLDYALREAAMRTLVPDGRGAIIQTKQGVNVALIYADEESREALQTRCTAFVEHGKTELGCQVACYVGERVGLPALKGMYEQLLDMEYDNVRKSGQVYWSGSAKPERDVPKFPAFAAWQIWIEQGKRAELEKEIRKTVVELGGDPHLHAGTIQAFYHGYLQMIHYVLQKNGLSAHELFRELDERKEGAMPRTLAQLEHWAIARMDIVTGQLHRQDSIVRRVQCYIADHLNETVKREDIADHVHLNQAYLSRLFKKETGVSLTDYMLQERMKLAHELIRGSTIPISDIAKSLGYNNFSYFSKMFKRLYGGTPQQCRRQEAGGGGLAADHPKV
ncbi:response regulator [Paenibacillus methanolicus]|uniref:Two-component system response regulator YesN n=1 Tax=Paenibacillus methanolicus TaxID=582686 RepID=A0A5S5CMS6_9BACL|nr:helix-turn-helix domain-containing protein [Paenibacillus methanolicus]TYP79791.1 two-component system response regulator YesN [Paenibacillus methanolicus]